MSAVVSISSVTTGPWTIVKGLSSAVMNDGPRKQGRKKAQAECQHIIGPQEAATD